MASTVTIRVTGTVLKAERMAGTAKATGNAYDFTRVRVLVADEGICELTLAKNQICPSRGDLIDYLAEVGVDRQGSPSVRASGDFPSDDSLIHAA